MLNRNYFVYILTTENNKVMYVGVTNNLQRRLYEHQQEIADSFTKRYHIHKLVYFEHTYDVKEAITREKQIKGWTRVKKNDLVESMNPEWKDLSGLVFE